MSSFPGTGSKFSSATAYSPPFSPALSPVIVAAQVLQNKLEGKLKWLSAAGVRKKMEGGADSFAILDVRDLKEVQEKRIPGSIWIPSEELEDRLGELDPGKELAVHCYSGVRSYKACLKLRHRGFKKVKNVDGGLLCWCYDLEEKSGGGATRSFHTSNYKDSLRPGCKFGRVCGRCRF